MVYMGGKGRVAADILPIILNGRTEDQVYIEPFCGGLNMIDKVANPRIANDKNVYLIEMWKALQQGMRFPWDISREHYVTCREAMRENSGRFTAAEIGWVGFMASFRGKFYEGYCGNNGGRKNVEEHIKNVMKQLPLINGIEFHSGEYSELSPPLIPLSIAIRHTVLLQIIDTLPVLTITPFTIGAGSKAKRIRCS